MRKHISLFIYIFLTFPVYIFPQMTYQKGKVTLQNSKNQPLSQVEVLVIESPPVQSDVEGVFSLAFNRRKPGDKILVQKVYKKGYEVVNQDALKTWRIASDPKEVFKIVLCPEGRIAENMAKYYNISLNSLTKSYRDNQRELQKQLDESKINEDYYREQAKLLGTQFELQQNQLAELSEKYARENFDDYSDVERQAFEAFQKGDIDESIRVRESIKSDEQIQKANKEIEKWERNKKEADLEIQTAKQVKKDNIRNLMKLAEEYSIKLKFKDAEETYEKAILADTSSYENIADFAIFLKKQNNYEKAIYWFKKALVLAENNKSQYKTVLALLGALFAEKTNFQNAEDYLNKAMEINNQLKNDNLYEESFEARILDNLGRMYRDKQDFLLAEKSFNRSLEIFERLAREYRFKYDPSVANICNNLSGVFWDKHDYPSAESELRRALAIREALAREDPKLYESDYAATLNNLGTLLRDKKELDSAEIFLKKSLEIRNSLAASNPEAYSADLALTLNNLGSIYAARNENALADSVIQQASDIYEKLAKLDPETYERFLAGTLSNLAMVIPKNNSSKIEMTIKRALEIRKKLASKKPETYNGDLAISYNSLGTFYFTQKDYISSETALKAAAEIREKLSKENPEVYLPYLAISYNNLGSLYSAKKDYESAEAVHKKALKIRQNLAEKNPQVFENELANTLYSLGLTYKNKKDLKESEKYCKKTLAVLEHLAEKNTDYNKPKIAMVLNSLGDIYKDMNDMLSAKSSYEKALEIYEYLSKRNNKKYESDVNKIKDNLNSLSKVLIPFVREVAINSISDSLGIKPDDIIVKYGKWILIQEINDKDFVHLFNEINSRKSTEKEILIIREKNKHYELLRFNFPAGSVGIKISDKYIDGSEYKTIKEIYSEEKKLDN